ncbi:succinylglutamate desuccinylase/aspartoacylase family protein [candidate division KSB1 bacterium]
MNKKNTIYLLIFAFIFLISVSVSAQSTLTVGEVTAKPGEKKSGFIQVPAGNESPAEQIPVTVVNGNRPGPVLALIAGTHGYEYPPVLALQRVGKQLDAGQLSGAVIIVHVMNMPSFMKRTIYYNPYDWQNQNRVFPGVEDGTSSQRIAFQITKHVIDQCDYLIDNHCGDGNEDLMTYLYCTVTGNAEMDKKIRGLAENFGIKVMIHDTGRPTDAGASVYVSNTAILRGKPAMTTEVGGLGKTDEEYVQVLVEGNFNIMKHLNMIDGKPFIRTDPVWVTHYDILRSSHDGLFYPLVHKGHHVQKGEVIGYVTDFFGNVVEEAVAPYDGMLMYIIATPPMGKGEPMAMIGGFDNKR